MNYYACMVLSNYELHTTVTFISKLSSLFVNIRIWMQLANYLRIRSTVNFVKQIHTKYWLAGFGSRDYRQQQGGMMSNSNQNRRGNMQSGGNRNMGGGGRWATMLHIVYLYIYTSEGVTCSRVATGIWVELEGLYVC